MRMWMLNPNLMCSQHISGEHNEITKTKPSFEKSHSIKGRLYPTTLIEPAKMKKRHDRLAQFLNHNSPYEMPDLFCYPEGQLKAKVDKWQSLCELYRRCSKCRAKIQQRLPKKTINKIAHEVQEKED